VAYWGLGVPRDAVLRIRSNRYLVPTNRHSGGPRLQQSDHRRHHRLAALGLPSIAHCPQTLAQDGVRGGITDAATDRFSPHGKPLIAISGAFVRERLRVSLGGQHG